jgi:hypothetical protein
VRHRTRDFNQLVSEKICRGLHVSHERRIEAAVVSVAPALVHVVVVLRGSPNAVGVKGVR